VSANSFVDERLLIQLIYITEKVMSFFSGRRLYFFCMLWNCNCLHLYFRCKGQGWCMTDSVKFSLTA
jgi:hypothetical protein